MRDHSKHIQVNKDEAVKIILKHCSFSSKTEEINTKDAAGRILAEDVFSKWDFPNCLTCRMDSVAVHFDDFKDGIPDTSDWKRGVDWEFANTGVAMPEGFDAAIVVEHVIFSEDDTKVAFDAAPSERYAGTSAPGSKMKKGDLVVEKNTEITPLLAAHIISSNNIKVKVLKKPVVAFLPTGNELVKAGGEIPTGKNIESNSYMIAEKIKSWGGEPLIFDVIPDEKDALERAMKKAADEADIVVLNAGSSKGNDDWGIEVLEEIGTVFYHQTNHGPGHHSSFGTIAETPVVGISGPPGGAGFTCDFYLYPAIMAYLGKEPHLKKIKAVLAEDIEGKKSGISKNVAKDTPSATEKQGDDNTKSKEKGESRPKETGEFYSIKHIILKQDEEGVIKAYPFPTSHPGPVEAEKADAYYAMPSWEGEAVPEAGDIIEVELRPDRG